MFMVWLQVWHKTHVHLSQSFLASVTVKFSLPIHVKVLEEEEVEVEDDEEVLADGVPFSSLL